MTWRNRAACRPNANGFNPLVHEPNVIVAEAFFEPASDHAREMAKRLCRRCPVTSVCLEEALDAGLDYGIWGGLEEQDRRRLKRRGAVRG
ncbi:WhiB family transcriptional regulator [Prauserella sp. PE36]|uniref:WhiB family transcriptional regulator n=1 Tax=Prauserella sp. PE36 TaxID=1504709 RepID=UPI000DE30F85|nr:WhiB family transcriptional regulator [Prauserella sp. PE36]RBM18090.1 WhiB family transcriptional regulator [Prauserella sp. PE36]